MKRVLLGITVATAASVFALAGAMAADGSAYMAQCKANIAAEKPPVRPDQPSSLTATSRISATNEFGLPAIASAIELDMAGPISPHSFQQILGLSPTSQFSPSGGIVEDALACDAE